MRLTPPLAGDGVASRVDQLFPLPLTGRQREQERLSARLDAARAGKGSTTLLAGAGGVGKSRLAAALAEKASRQGWSVSVGRAYPVETGVPYALFADALAPIVRGLAPGALAVLTRGEAGTLASISPAFSTTGLPAPAPDAGDAKARLLWSCSQFLGQLSTQRPLLLVLENLQWADRSSLELLHFIARQIGGQRIALLCTYNESVLDANPALRTTEQSLLSVGAAELMRLEPLDADALHSIVRAVFHADESSARVLSGRLYSWSRGNPFFAEEILKALVHSGALYHDAGAWHGWDAEPPGLPRSIRDALADRLERLRPAARSLANLAAVIGTRTSHQALEAASGSAEGDVLASLDELRTHGVLKEEAEPGGGIRYEFTHPLVRDVLYAELGMARCRTLHGAVAESLERHYAHAADAHADELAFHFARAEARAVSGKAIRYLVVAGRSALARHANREAADYLAAALELRDRTLEKGDAEPSIDAESIAELLARARQRLGDYPGATALWSRVRTVAERHGDDARLGTVERRLGLGAYWSGRYRDALVRFDSGLAAAMRARDESLEARIRVARAMTLQALGDRERARAEVDAALEIAEKLRDSALLARVHRASLLLHIFVGPADRAEADGLRAIEFAEAAGERGVEWSAHWAMAMVGGLTGNGAAMTRHLAEGERLAEALGSPVLRCWMAEIEIEYASGTGDWDRGLALAERTIPLARALGQRVLLPRLLVWAALVHLHRGGIDRAKEYLDEASLLTNDSGAGLLDVHSAAPVHAGLVAYHIARGAHRRAVEVGEHGLAHVDRTGSIAWAVHRLLPGIIEAALWMRDLETAERYRDRLRRDSTQLGHRLGLAWADTSDALIRMLREDYEGAIPLLRRGAGALDAIPWVLDAARARRNLGWALGMSGDRDAAARELRHAHDQFVRLGAEPELARTREVMRELNVRLPARAQNAGVGALTGREVDVALLAAEHKSNKEIASTLGISPRTVSTHLSNIFEKLEVATRGELADVVRREGIGAA